MDGAWLGNDWQEYCLLLLGRRWSVLAPHSLQRVPDRHQGDLGLEAFSLHGHGYQCYAAEEPLTTQACYEKQRDKLTSDLRKLRDRQAEVGALLGTVALHRYVFLVPRHDSRRLIEFANEKAQEVKSWGLPFIADDFTIVIETAADYAAEQAHLHNIPKPLIVPVPTEPEEAKAWADEHDDLRQEAQGKLQKIIPSDATVDAVLESLIGQYLAGENALERMRIASPDGYAALLAKKAHQERLLVLKYPTSSGTPNQGSLTEISDDVANELRDVNPLVDGSLAQTLAWSSIADWLMRCPLDFGPSSA